MLETFKDTSSIIVLIQMVAFGFILISMGFAKTRPEDEESVLSKAFAVRANENLDLMESNARLKNRIAELEWIIKHSKDATLLGNMKKDLDLCHATIADLHDKNEQFAKENTDFLTRAIASELEVEKLQDTIHSLNSEILLRKEVA